MNTRRLCHSLVFSRAAVAMLVLFALTSSRPAVCGPIHDAAGDGDLAKVKALLKDNPALAFSKDNNSQTPLHWAAASLKVIGTWRNCCWPASPRTVENY
jgi:ankyrin repeat protein